MVEPRTAAARTRILVLVLAFLVFGIAGCSYSSREPGLFRQSDDQPSAPSPETSNSPSADGTSPGGAASSVPAPDAALPVLGTRVWTSGEGLHIPLRIAVHAVRRFVGGTVLDWSVTPLPTAIYRVGNTLPAVDLGLTRFGEGDVNIFLIDAAHHRVYRPLTALEHDDLEHCLCAPQWIAERELRVGVTTLLQVAYPSLPAGVERVAVDVTTVALFDQVPVTAVGQSPRPGATVDLARAGGAPSPTVWTKPFGYPAAPGQKLRIGVDQVAAGPSGTSIVWTLQSLTTGTQVSSVASPPLVADDAGSAYDYADGYASAPAITAVDGRPRTPMAALSMSTRLNGLGRRECLCTDPRLWSSGLQDAGSQVDLVTVVGALPAGRTTVDVTFPGLPTLRHLRVVAAADSAAAVRGSAATPPKTWTYFDPDPGAGWPVEDWPSPVPNDRQMSGYRATVDDLF